MLSTESAVSALITLLVLGYILLHIATLLVVSPTASAAPEPWNVVGMLRECLGAALRKLQGEKSYRFGMRSFEVFGLHTNQASLAELDKAKDLLLTKMRQHPWLYPKSQQGAVEALADQFNLLITIRIRLESISREFAKERQRAEERAYAEEKARHYWENDEKFRTVTSYGWRQVLGLPESERDVHVIKQAYRKRAQSAHPDRGGSNDAMAKLNQAIEQAREELSFV